jgi:hypothetical protein
VNLSIAGPSQTTLQPVMLEALNYCYVTSGTEKIGVLLRGFDTSAGSHTTLALWPTAVMNNWSSAPFGRWTLSSPTNVQIWLARDDRNTQADQGRPRRPSHLWDAAYRRTTTFGAMLLDDDPGSAIHRNGTLSALATALHPAVIDVQADEKLGSGPRQPAGYSSRPYGGQPLSDQVLVDDGWPGRGVMAAANGGARRVRISGTSAAAGLYARTLVLPNLPPGD